ncbi:MAG: hypothetical protein C4288_01045 [Leptolyngbya sp. ERB_1_1]
METLLVFGVMALMSLGLISLGELIVRSLKSRDAQPVDYTPVGTGLEGLSGVKSGDITHLFGSIGAHISRFFEHFLHH